MIAAVVSARLATLVELQSTLSAQDAYELLEIAAVDAFNKRPPE